MRLGKRARKPAILIVLVLAIAGSAVGWRATQANSKPEQMGGEKTFEFAPGDLVQLAREPLGRTVPVSGSVRPVLAATVRAKVPAEVARVHVNEGDRVQAGQPLATLDSADLKARLDREHAAVAEARARLDLARKNQANNKALLEKSFISQNAYDSVQNAVQVAEANLKSAEAQAAIAERALADAQVRAPFQGIVAKRFVNVGDKVSQDMPVLQLVDLSRMELEAQLPVNEIPYVSVGQRIAFRVDGFPSREFGGKVERINPSADAGSRSIAIFVALPNADGSLKGGMFAHGILNTAAGTEVDVIPTAALIEEGGQTYVYVLKGGKVERRTLTLGVRNKERGLVEVREGLEKGVSVITAKAQGLKPGATGVVAGAKS
jgi:membrane fusion protein, multidrug efflux system